MVVGDRVWFKIDNSTGNVVRIRHDDRGDAIITIFMDDAHYSPDGIMYARTYEVDTIEFNTAKC